MNTSKMRSVVWHIIRTPLMQHNKPKALTGKRIYAIDSGENLLIAGELSDGQRKTIRIPKGYLAVYVGEEEPQRFVIPARYLSMPDFRILMDKVGEEYGYEHEGGLRIPCEEQDFLDLLTRCNSAMQRNKSKAKTKNYTH